MRTPHQIIVLPGETRTEYVTREIREHRAPTDASIALLKEMEEKAAAKVAEAVRLEGNGFNCVVHVERDVLSDQTVVAVLFDLNGKREKVEHRFGRSQRDEDVMAEVRNKVAERIAGVMLASVFSEMARL